MPQLRAKKRLSAACILHVYRNRHMVDERVIIQCILGQGSSALGSRHQWESREASDSSWTPRNQAGICLYSSIQPYARENNKTARSWTTVNMFAIISSYVLQVCGHKLGYWLGVGIDWIHVKQKMKVTRSLLDDIKTKQLQCYGHVQRMEEERLP